MQNDQLILAIGRLERALQRAETAARRLTETDARDGADTIRLRDLEERHERLRTATQSAIAEIDRLMVER